MKNLTVLSMITAALLLTACGDTATGAEAKASHETKTEKTMKCSAGKCGDAMKKDATSEAKAAVSNAAEKVKAAAAEKATAAVNSAKEAAEKAKEAVAEKATEAVDSAKEAAASAVDSAKEKASAAVDSVKEAAASATAAVASAADTGAGKALFAKCAGCHGADGKTKAMGKSAIIAGQSPADLDSKIHAYKAGTRNEAGMGMVMKGQVASLSDDDIKAVATYISGL